VYSGMVIPPLYEYSSLYIHILFILL
jgi:hypothetical protein